MGTARPDAFRVLIAGGGTGGHVFPALALAEALQSAVSGVELLFVGSAGGLEASVVPRHGHRIELLQVGKLRGVGVLAGAAAIGALVRGTVRAARLLVDFTPHVVVGVGGYASAPVVLAAFALGLPVVLLEQNAIPGTTNRALARLARRVVVAFRGAARYLPEGRTVLLGNPVRASLLDALRREPPAGDENPLLLVLGGSQGAHALNELMVGAAPELFRRVPHLRLRHQTGRADAESVREAYRRAGVDAAVEPFIDDMGPALRAASLVLGRSGATSLAELCAAGCPAVLVPYPYAADDHQAANAQELVQAGGAELRRQSDLDPASLAALIGGLVDDPERLARMGRAMRACAYPDAGPAIARMLHDEFGGCPPPLRGARALRREPAGADVAKAGPKSCAG